MKNRPNFYHIFKSLKNGIMLLLGGRV